MPSTADCRDSFSLSSGDPLVILLSHFEASFAAKPEDLVNFITALNSNRLTKQMDSRIALVTWEFFIRLLKRLRYDVFDVWLHEGPKADEARYRVFRPSTKIVVGHCRRRETTGFAPVA